MRRPLLARILAAFLLAACGGGPVPIVPGVPMPQAEAVRLAMAEVAPAELQLTGAEPGTFQEMVGPDGMAPGESPLEPGHPVWRVDLKSRDGLSGVTFVIDALTGRVLTTARWIT